MTGGGRPRYGYYALPLYVVVCAVPAIVGLCAWWAGRHVGVVWLSGAGIGLCACAGLQAVGCWLGVYVLPEGRVTRARRIATSVADGPMDCLVDIGAGRGVLSVEFAKALDARRVIAVDLWTRPARSQGVDYDRSAPVFAHTAAHTRRNVGIEGMSDRVHLVTTDATRLGIRSESADVVTAGYVLFHLHEGGRRRSDERRLRALHEWRRVLRPGGRLVVFDLTHTGWTNGLAWTPAGYFASRWLSTRLTPAYWVALLTAAGFDVDRREERRGNLVLVARKLPEQ